MTIKSVNFGNFSNDDWDDPPPTPVAISQVASRGGKPAIPYSSYVSMELDNGLLPVRIDFSSNWSQMVTPGEVGRELYRAYEGAIFQLITRAVEATGGWENRRDFTFACSTPRRKQLELLLDTTSWDQYERAIRSIASRGEFTAHSATLDYGNPVMTVKADRFSIKSIAVWPNWSGCSDTGALQSEMLACADQIRIMRPKFEVLGDYSHYSDDELESLNRNHYVELIDRQRSS